MKRATEAHAPCWTLRTIAVKNCRLGFKRYAPTPSFSARCRIMLASSMIMAANLLSVSAFILPPPSATLTTPTPPQTPNQHTHKPTRPSEDQVGVRTVQFTKLAPTCLNSSDPNWTCAISDLRIASAIACKSANSYMHTHCDPAMWFQPVEITTTEPPLPSHAYRWESLESKRIHIKEWKKIVKWTLFSESCLLRDELQALSFVTSTNSAS